MTGKRRMMVSATFSTALCLTTPACEQRAGRPVSMSEDKMEVRVAGVGGRLKLTDLAYLEVERVGEAGATFIVKTEGHGYLAYWDMEAFSKEGAFLDGKTALRQGSDLTIEVGYGKTFPPLFIYQDSHSERAVPRVVSLPAHQPRLHQGSMIVEVRGWD